MVPHERGEDAELEPAHHQILRGVRPEACQVRPCVEEAAHAKGRHHFHVHEQMGPPGQVVSLPDAAVAVHADVGGAGEHKDPLVRLQLLKSLPGCPGHVVAVQVVDFVVAHSGKAATRLVVEAPVILRVVCQGVHKAQQVIVLVQIQVLPLHGGHLVKYFVQTFLGVEDGGLVHVVPEAVDALVQKELVFQAKPSPGLRVQHIREMRPSRPHSSHKVGAVLLLAEVAGRFSFLVDRVAILDLDAGVDDGDQVDALLFHVRSQGGQIREFLF